MMLTFPLHLRNSTSENEYLLLEKHKAGQFDKQKMISSFSPGVIRYALDLSIISTIEAITQHIFIAFSIVIE